MKSGKDAHAVVAFSNARRTILRSMSLALPSMLLTNLPALAFASTVAAPARGRGGATINVRDKGARGDGQNDDTAAFQAAIDALPGNGGTVHVPGGTYAIDATVSVHLRNAMHLDMAPDAKLVALPNSSPRGYVLYVFEASDVEISGGQIVGERARHMGVGGEWGHGIQIRGASRVTVRDIRISDCWGDGVTIGGSGVHQANPSNDIFIANIVSTGNRRQGLSIGRSTNVRVYDSEFSNTSGTAPQCGIDIEPDRPGGASGIHIENCVVRNNSGAGIQIYKRVDDVTVTHCTIEGNRRHGIFAAGASNGVITDNQIDGNGLAGVAFRQQSSNFRVSGNRFYGNAGLRHEPQGNAFGLGGGRGKGGRGSPDVQVGNDTSGIDVTANIYGNP